MRHLPEPVQHRPAIASQNDKFHAAIRRLHFQNCRPHLRHGAVRQITQHNQDARSLVQTADQIGFDCLRRLYTGFALRGDTIGNRNQPIRRERAAKPGAQEMQRRIFRTLRNLGIQSTVAFGIDHGEIERFSTTLRHGKPQRMRRAFGRSAAVNRRMRRKLGMATAEIMLQ